jgi:hypothetical protein
MERTWPSPVDEIMSSRNTTTQPTTSPIRTPTRMPRAAPRNTAAENSAARSCRPPQQLGFDQGAALVVCERDRECRLDRNRRVLGCLGKAECQAKRRIERDFRQRRQHANERLDDSPPRLAGARDEAKRHAGDYGDGKPTSQAPLSGLHADARTSCRQPIPGRHRSRSAARMRKGTSQRSAGRTRRA